MSSKHLLNISRTHRNANEGIAALSLRRAAVACLDSGER